MAEKKHWISHPWVLAIIPALLVGILLWPEGQRPAALTVVAKGIAGFFAILATPVRVPAGILIGVAIVVGAIVARKAYGWGREPMPVPADSEGAAPASNTRGPDVTNPTAQPDPVNLNQTASDETYPSSPNGPGLAFAEARERLAKVKNRPLELRELKRQFDGLHVEWHGHVKGITEFGSESISVSLAQDPLDLALDATFWADFESPNLAQRALALRVGDQILVRGRLSIGSMNTLTIDAEGLDIRH